MKVYHIGTIALESTKTKRELKSIGGISGYILELIKYSQIKSIKIGFIGKIYSYEESCNIEYLEVQKNVTSTIQFLRSLLKKSIASSIEKTAIIHAHRPDHLAAFYFFNRRSSIISLHGQQAHTVNIRKGKTVRTIYHVLEKYALKKAKYLIAVDDITNDFYSKLYPEHKNKIITIPTGVNNNIFKILDIGNLRDTYHLNTNDKIIVYVGRIEPPKRIDLLLKAFSKTYKRKPEYKLLIIGDGVLKSEMETFASEIGLGDVVQFLGVRKRDELPYYFNMADVSVLISDNEGSPLSVKESLACGTPVIANNAGDIASVIRNGENGYIIEKENIGEISSKIVWAAENKMILQENCVNSTHEYTIDKVSQKVIELYKSLPTNGK